MRTNTVKILDNSILCVFDGLVNLPKLYIILLLNNNYSILYIVLYLYDWYSIIRLIENSNKGCVCPFSQEKIFVQ